MKKEEWDGKSWEEKFDIVKLNLMRYRVFSLCGRCVKHDVCEHHTDRIVQIMTDVETTGKTDIETWNYCSFYLKGKLPDASLKVERK